MTSNSGDGNHINCCHEEAGCGGSGGCCCGGGVEAQGGIEAVDGSDAESSGVWQDGDSNGGCCCDAQSTGVEYKGSGGGGVERCCEEEEGCSGDCGRSSQNASMNCRTSCEDIYSSPSRY